MKQQAWLALFVTMMAVAFGCNRMSQNQLALSIQDAPPNPLAPASTCQFADPVRLEAEGEVIAVDEPGYACPTVADVDGDGSADLVVGQFASGRMRFFRNLAGAGEVPVLASQQWIMTGNEPATVPGVW